MTAIDISETFLRYACEKEEGEKLGIDYQLASAVALPFPDSFFDFAIAVMSLMDIPEQKRVLRESYRILKPGSFLQFSISHPCFATPRWKWVYDETGQRVAVECGNYFCSSNGEIKEWIFGATPPEMKQKLRKFRIPRFVCLMCLLKI